MSYNYEIQLPKIMNEEGVGLIFKIHRNAREISKVSSVFTFNDILKGCTGDTFDWCAAVDFLVKNGHLKLVHNRFPSQTSVYELV